MKDNAKTVCINFRISPKNKLYLDELVVEEGLNSISDYFNKQILMRKIESILKKIINDAKKRVEDEYKLSGRLFDKIESPFDIEGIFSENEEKIKNKWIDEVKNLVITELGLENNIKDLSNVWPQIANFTSDYSVIKKLTFLVSHKNEKVEKLT